MDMLLLFEQFARSGGGGSSSGGSDGGGGIALIGYFPSYYLAKFIKKLLSRPVALTITIAVGVIASVLVFVLMRFNIFSVLIAVGIWSGWSAAMFDFWDKMKKRLKKADADLAAAGWSEEALKQTATQLFIQYQYDWSRRDSSNFANYMTPYYATHAGLMVRTLAEMNRQNIVSDVKIIRTDTSVVSDSADDSQDSFSMFIEAQANDQLLDLVTGQTIYTETKPFIEEWSFQRRGQTWVLSGIRQSTEEPSLAEQDMRQFAQAKSMFYSLDMGFLFVPKRGQLFKEGQIQQSDINNHVVGSYNNHLVQLYTYRNTTGDNAKNYLVGQINLPKSYGGILVRRKQGLLGGLGSLFAPKGYAQYTFEWPDFNNRYAVYATESDRLATFELLNPGFMAFLHDNFSDVSIEVVDNIVYFFAEKKSTRSDYEQLMQLLERAFKELQL